MGWSDVGSWEALYEIGQKEICRNAVQGNVVAIVTADCLLTSTGQRLVTFGVGDLIVAVTPEAVLVTKREFSQRMREVADALKALPEEDRS